MTLMRGFSRVDKDGKIQIPTNIRHEADLGEGQLVEIKITGATKKKNIIISTKNNTR
jgi:bifunctional DNA-binding transcriptional regulator/antitoxin component of YhaV-PrlF toxin-antitoxin module